MDRSSNNTQNSRNSFRQFIERRSVLITNQIDMQSLELGQIENFNLPLRKAETTSPLLAISEKFANMRAESSRSINRRGEEDDTASPMPFGDSVIKVNKRSELRLREESKSEINNQSEA